MELISNIQPLIFDSAFIRSEQPTTCPKCGARTEIIFDLSHSINGTQIHKCLSKNCNYTFVEEVE